MTKVVVVIVVWEDNNVRFCGTSNNLCNYLYAFRFLLCWHPERKRDSIPFGECDITPHTLSAAQLFLLVEQKEWCSAADGRCYLRITSVKQNLVHILFLWISVDTNKKQANKQATHNLSD
jgi:hypothetical protein